MAHFTEISDVIVVSKEFMNQYTRSVAELASIKAIEEYRTQKSKDEKLTVSDISKQEKCNPSTVISWINKGVKKGKIKLKAYRKGTSQYIITRYDLNNFINQKTNYDNII